MKKRSRRSGHLEEAVINAEQHLQEAHQALQKHNAVLSKITDVHNYLYEHDKVLLRWMHKLMPQYTYVIADGRVTVLPTGFNVLCFEICFAKGDGEMGLWPRLSLRTNRYVDQESNDQMITEVGYQSCHDLMRKARETGIDKILKRTIHDNIFYDTNYTGVLDTQQQASLAFLLCDLCHAEEVPSMSIFKKDLLRRIKSE